MIEIVSATRLSEEQFWKKSALGISLRRLQNDKRLQPRILVNNRLGLPNVYNARIEAEIGNDVIVFIHDDVWIDDFHFGDRIIEGLQRYDVIGVAGNRRRLPQQPGWAYIDTQFTWDDPANLSGAVAGGTHPFGSVAFFGHTPADCELLDGVFLATKKSILRAKGVLFDVRFEFHFYDLDFCRTARQRGLKLGTWPICLTHQSGGSFSSVQWQQKYQTYVEKWGS
jgi:GT2 family glycosyltransferase